MTVKNQWWGYKHTEGTYQAKRYFEPLDIQEANESPFCEIVVGPFMAANRDEAIEIIKTMSEPKEIHVRLGVPDYIVTKAEYDDADANDIPDNAYFIGYEDEEGNECNEDGVPLE